MKKMIKRLSGLFAVVLLLTVCAPLAAAEEYYTYNGHTFAQGIERVECFNAVEESAYATLHAAVDTAILDWDWHLALLNEQYGVNWNVVSFVGNRLEEVPMIECVTMTNAEYVAYTDDDLEQGQLVDVIYYGIASGTERSAVEHATQNWYSAKIIFLTDHLQADGKLGDYEYLRGLANHEIGHALGLAHDTTDCGVIMYPNGTDRTAWVPTAKDLATVYYLYG